MSRRVVVALVVASTRRAHVRNARAPRRRPPRAPLATSCLPRALVPMVDAPPAESADAPDAASPDDPAPPRSRASPCARRKPRGEAREGSSLGRLSSSPRLRARARPRRRSSRCSRASKVRTQATPRGTERPPPFAPRSFAPPIRPVASRRFLSPMDRSNRTRSSAILSDHPTRDTLAALRVDRHSSPRPPHPSAITRQHASRPRLRGPRRPPRRAPPPTPPLGTPSSSPTTTADASRASTGATRRSARAAARPRQGAQTGGDSKREVRGRPRRGAEGRRRAKRKRRRGGSAERRVRPATAAAAAAPLFPANVSKIQRPAAAADAAATGGLVSLVGAPLRIGRDDAAVRALRGFFLERARSRDHRAHGFGRSTDPSEPSEGGVGSAAPLPSVFAADRARRISGARITACAGRRRPRRGDGVLVRGRCASAWTARRGAPDIRPNRGREKERGRARGARAGSRSRGGGAGPSALVLVDVGSGSARARAGGVPPEGKEGTPSRSIPNAPDRRPER